MSRDKIRENSFEPFRRAGISRDASRNRENDAPVRLSEPLALSAPVPAFSGDTVFPPLSREAASLLSRFGEIAREVFPLDKKKLHALPKNIATLSHLMTDSRADRRIGYMNDPANVSAYVHYFMWWNLLRFSRLFSRLIRADDFPENFCAVDLGSGPLTAVCALWIACPELRRKKITWYCVDLSRDALAAGEEVFLRLAAATQNEPWEIVRVRGTVGVPVKKKAALVICANLFNELSPVKTESKTEGDRDSSRAPRKNLALQTSQASAVSRAFAAAEEYAAPHAKLLLIEPGNPDGGAFVSAFRKKALGAGFFPLAPCPHTEACPFPGGGKAGRGKKWCHFAFPVEPAPEKLRSLSAQAGLSKDRAVLSFVYLSRPAPAGQKKASGGDGRGEGADKRNARGEKLPVRVVSDEIALPFGRTGRYACSACGMLLLTGRDFSSAGGRRAKEAHRDGGSSRTARPEKKAREASANETLSPAEFLRRLPFGATLLLSLNRNLSRADGSPETPFATDPKTGAVTVSLFRGTPREPEEKPRERTAERTRKPERSSGRAQRGNPRKPENPRRPRSR